MSTFTFCSVHFYVKKRSFINHGERLESDRSLSQTAVYLHVPPDALEKSIKLVRHTFHSQVQRASSFSSFCICVIVQSAQLMQSTRVTPGRCFHPESVIFPSPAVDFLMHLLGSRAVCRQLREKEGPDVSLINTAVRCCSVHLEWLCLSLLH